MLRSIDDWEGEHFAFKGAPAPQESTSVAIENGEGGPTATIPDAHLLFTAQFARAGDNLLLHGEDGRSFVVQDYFATDDLARLLSPEGAALSPAVIAALAGPLAPGQYAQAGTAPAAAQAVGRVVQADSDATIVRNGVVVAANTGDPILKGDVLQTVSGRIGVTFNDGSTLNLTANTRLVVNEFVYDPRGSANSQLLDLVQGSLTFISGEVAHSGNMSIGTPVATMGIRGTVGGVTTATDGTVRFYVSQSATGAVIIDGQGRIIANVVQDGPLIIVRPAGPLQVLAEEVQKSPAQLALELAALQQILSTKAVGDQLIQQFFQQDPNQQNPNPQSTDKPLTQIQTYQIDLKFNSPIDDANDDTALPPYTAIFTPLPDDDTDATPIIIDNPVITEVNAAPVATPIALVVSENDAPVTIDGLAGAYDPDADDTLHVDESTVVLSSFDGQGQPLPYAVSYSVNGSQITIDPAQFNYLGAGEVAVLRATYDVVDSSGAHVATSATVTVNGVNDAPMLNFFSLNLSSGGPVVLTPDDYDVTDPDGPVLNFIVTNVMGGEFVVDSGNDSFALYEDEGEGSGPVTFTSDDIAAGRVSFVPDGSGDPVSYSISVSDGIASSTSIEDHVPQAVDIETETTAGSAANLYNIVIVLDVSGSMGGQRLIDAKAAIANLLGSQNVEKINSVMAVSFASDAHVYIDGGSHWVTASQANSYFQLRTAGGGTDYEDAIAHVIGTMPLLSPPEGADKTFVYFISDGEPTEGNMGVLQAQWEQFLRCEGIDTSYAIGISAAVNDTDLAPIAWDSNNPNFQPINLQNTADLANTLQSTVISTQNIFSDGDASLGGDGGRVLSITVDGETHTWDGFNTISSSSEGPWTKTAASITLTTALGGILTFYFGDEGQAHAGDWTYTPPDNVDYSTKEVFRYTLVDNDGDKSSANITVKVYDQDGPAPTNDLIVTNAGSFYIPDWVLLRNDNDPDGFLSLTDANTDNNEEATATVGHDEGGYVTVDLNGAGHGDFQYLVSDSQSEAEATVAVSQSGNLDLSLSEDNSIIIADDSGVTMAGGSGSDVLIGGSGNDTMTGNGDGDVFVFRAGGGEDTIIDFAGQTYEGSDVIALDGFSFTSFEELQALFEDIGADGYYATLIDFGDGNSITLVDVDRNDLTAADFMFHAASYNIG